MGYIAPEWLRQLRISVKSDVFGFGKVVKESLIFKLRESRNRLGFTIMLLHGVYLSIWERDKLVR